MANIGITANSGDSGDKVDKIKDATMPFTESSLFEANRRAIDASFAKDERFASMPDWQKVATKVGAITGQVVTYEEFLNVFVSNPELDIVTITVNGKKFSIVPTDVLDKLLAK